MSSVSCRASLRRSRHHQTRRRQTARSKSTTSLIPAMSTRPYRPPPPLATTACKSRRKATWSLTPSPTAPPNSASGGSPTASNKAMSPPATPCRPIPSRERIPFEWNRDTLYFILSGACPCRKTGSTFPENALALRPRRGASLPPRNAFLIAHRFQHLGGVGVHVEPRKLAVAHRPDVGKGGRERPAGFLEGSGIGPERNHPITLGDELVRLDGKPLPVAGKRLEEIIQDGLRAVPGAAVVRKTFRLGPFDLRIEKRQHRGDVPATEGIVKAANGSGRRGHDCLRVGEERVKPRAHPDRGSGCA